MAHLKFIGWTPAAQALVEAAGVADMVDEGWFDLSESSAADFIEACRDLRHWDREPAVDQT